MDILLHWIGVTLAFGFVGVCLIGFIRGLSLTPNRPENRVNVRDDTWRH